MKRPSGVQGRVRPQAPHDPKAVGGSKTNRSQCRADQQQGQDSIVPNAGRISSKNSVILPPMQVLPAPTEPLDTRIQVETPEHVVFPYRVAGPGPRGMAWLIDLALRGVVLIAIAIGLLIASIGFKLGEIGIGVYLVIFFLMDWGWYTVCDGLFEGRTPGRVAMGLRVIREDGSPIGWREAFLRNLLRPADAFPGIYLVGVVASMADTRFRRLGDLVAGTVVVHTTEARATHSIAPIPAPNEKDQLLLQGRVRLSVEEQTALEKWMDVRTKLGDAWGYAVADRVIENFRDRHRIRHSDSVRNLELLLLAARMERAPEAEPPLWEDLRRLGGEQSLLDAEDVRRLLTAYRSGCADLGRRGARLPLERREPLEELCARAHSTIYRVPPALGLPNGHAILQAILSDFPLEVRKQKLFVLASAGLFLLPMLVAGLMAAGNPEFAEAVLPAAVREGLESSYMDAPSRSAGENAMMAGFYVFNNVGIALRSIGAGIFLGLGTAWVLIYNGLILGTVMGYLTAGGMGDNLLRFTSGHSSWELTALVIAGAAGLKIGWALVHTNGLGRLASLKASGTSIARLAGGAAVMLLVAAMIEGFWSAQELPDWARVVFALANFSAVCAWLGGVGQGSLARER